MKREKREKLEQTKPSGQSGVHREGSLGSDGHHIWFREGGTGEVGILKKGEMGRAGDWGSRVCFSWCGLCTGSC